MVCEGHVGGALEAACVLYYDAGRPMRVRLLLVGCRGTMELMRVQAQRESAVLFCSYRRQPAESLARMLRIR